MALSNLTAQELLVIGECLACVATGEVIEDDFEFETVWSIEFSDLQAVAAAWPLVDETDEKTFLAISGSLGNLLGYPHGKMHHWSRYISVSPQEVTRIFDKWRGRQVNA